MTRSKISFHLYKFLALLVFAAAIAVTATDTTLSASQGAAGSGREAGLLTSTSAVVTTPLAGNKVVIIPDPLLEPTVQQLVTGLPVDATPHGLALYGTDNALVADISHSRIFVIQLSTASLVSTIDTSAVGYLGDGSIAVSPNGQYALAIGNNQGAGALHRIQAPFGPTSAIDVINVPGVVNQGQTDAIAFDAAGRAFILLAGQGVAVLDPPYTSVAFVMLVQSVSGSISISSNGNTLLTTDGENNRVYILQAPFSDSTTAVELSIPMDPFSNGIGIRPDGLGAIVASGITRRASSIKGPFSAQSSVSQLPIPNVGPHPGFESVAFNASGTAAILAGGSGNQTGEQLYLVTFGCPGTITQLPIQDVNAGRGAGAVRFVTPVGGHIPRYTRGDYDGDNKTDLAVWRPTQFAPNLSAFYTMNSSNGGVVGLQFGNTGDVAIPGDFDGDNKTDYGVSRYNTSAGGVDLIALESATCTAKYPVWGNAGDIFISGDYDGDHKTDVMAWRPSEGTWYIVNSSGANGGFSFVRHGQNGDKPYAMDTDGDGKSNLVYFRPATGNWVVRNNDGTTATTNFGLSTDIPVPADYDGDDKDDIAVFRDGLWIVKKSSNGQVEFSPFGAAGDVPVPGDYDGDNLYDRAVYRGGIWHILRSTQGYTGVQFGAPTDTAMPKAYIP